MELMSDCLWAEAYVTTFDIGLNVFLEARPIVFLADKILDFIDVKMSYQRLVVVSIDKLCLDGFWEKR